jgi:hypothetical protein
LIKLKVGDAPAVREERDALSIAVRSFVLRSGDVEALWSYSRTEFGADDDILERLRILLAVNGRAAPYGDSVPENHTDSKWDVADRYYPRQAGRRRAARTPAAP